MNTQSKTFVRAVVVAGLLAWPGVETFRLIATQQKAAAAEELQRTVQAKLDVARAKHIQMAGSGDATAAPGTK
jgi:hypothetical protein